jgi:7,8-dihydro-6-hydroxymethylpterin-pyrophosphokinase
LDIIFFADRKMDHAELVIPHPHWRERPSVTIPLKSLPKAGHTPRRRYENLDI